MTTRHFAEGNDRVVDKGPCPKCGSKDNLVRYADGHAHCFTPGCGHWEAGDDAGQPKAKRPMIPDTLLSPDRPDAWEDLADRKLKSATLRRYGYFRGTFKGKGVQVAPYHDQDGNLVAQKLRLPDKSFPVLKADGYVDLTSCALFGTHVYGDRFDRRVIVTEGELDALSVAQVLDFKTAVVSVNTGAEVAKTLKANYRWLDRFGEIVLLFDDDERGRQATEEAAKLFAVGKVRIGRIPGFKDASAALQAGRPGDIEAAIYMARAWSPKGIVNAADAASDLDPETAEEAVLAYPWKGVEEALRGMAAGEVVYHVAGTGIGKSTFLREIAHSLAWRQGIKIGYMGFEDARRDLQIALLTVHASRDLVLDPLPPEALRALHAEFFGTRRVELFDAETAEWTVEAILGYVRYMAKALDCRVIFIDPLSFIIAAMSLGDDERRALDKVSQDLARLAKEMGITIHVGHHLRRSQGEAHEEGAPIHINEVRGSGGVANFASTVVGYERDQQGERPDLTRIRILKNRRAKFTGLASVLRYDVPSGRAVETDEPFPDKKRKGGGERGGFGTHPTGTDY